jgi:hypothetical protein
MAQSLHGFFLPHTIDPIVSSLPGLCSYLSNLVQAELSLALAGGIKPAQLQMSAPFCKRKKGLNAIIINIVI